MITKINNLLDERLASLHRDCLELIQETSLENLLDRVAALACDLTGAAFAAVGVIDERGKITQFTQSGAPTEIFKDILSNPQRTALFSELLRSGDPIHLQDLMLDPRLSDFFPVLKSLTGFVCIPIRLVDKILGQIYLVDKSDFLPFTEEDELVIQTVASYTAAAIVQLRMIRDYKKRDASLKLCNEDLSMINELGSALSSSKDIDDILEKAITRIMEVPKIAVGEIFLSEEDGKTLRLMTHQGLIKGSIWTKDQYIIGASFVGVAAESGNPYIADITGKVRKELKKSALNAGLNQIACFPLKGQNNPVGVLCLVTRTDQVLDDREVQLFNSISGLIAIATENVRDYFQGRKNAILEERDRIGMDLHDSIIQSIYGVGLTLEHARLLIGEDTELASRRIDHAIDDLNSTIRDIRSYILDLRPRQLHEQDLMVGLQRLVAEFRANTLVDATLEGMQKEPINIPPQNALALFHICQESLANTAKHAKAHKVSVTLWSTSRRMLLEVKDDGVGFDISNTNKNLGHGLANIATRAHNAGGDVEITSSPGEGTTILAWVPNTNGR